MGASRYIPLSNDKGKRLGHDHFFPIVAEQKVPILYCPGVYFPSFVQMLRVHQKDSHSAP